MQFESALLSELSELLGFERLLTIHCPIECWNVDVGHWRPQVLPFVWFGLRTAAREEFAAILAHLVYEEKLQLLHVLALGKSSRVVSPAFRYTQLVVNIARGLEVCTHILVKADNTRKFLQPPYKGPCKVSKHGEPLVKTGRPKCSSWIDWPLSSRGQTSLGGRVSARSIFT